MIEPMPVAIEVAPVAHGWAVRSSSLPNDMMFAGGGAAEAAARRLAERLSDAGQPVRLLVRLRNGAVAGRFIYAPRPAVPDLAAGAEGVALT